MMHLMRVVGAALDGWAQQALAKLKLWAEPYRKVSLALRPTYYLLLATSYLLLTCYLLLATSYLHVLLATCYLLSHA